MAGETNGNAHEMEIENNSQDSTADQSNIEFDENSGKTLSPAGPWFQAIKARKNKKSPNEDSIQEGGKQGNSQNQQGGLNARSNPRVESSMQANSNQQREQDQGSRTNGKLPPRRATLPLPENHYKVVSRPRTGMKLSSWPDEKITEGLARASGSPFKEFCANVTIQTQWKPNLIIASTADEDYALKLGSINGIELGVATYEMTPYFKPLPGTTSSSSSEYGTSKPQQEQQISWAEGIASSKSATDPFPSLPTQERNSRYEETISSLRRQNADLMKRNKGLMKRLEEQERRQEERDRRAQAREQALEMKLQHLIDQLQKQQEPTTTPTPPREHTPPIEDLESGIEHKMNKARTEDKAELRNEFRTELAQAVDTISKSVAATIQAGVQTLRQEITQMGNELSQRISILEKDIAIRQEKSQNTPSEKPR
ncbi:hypothetical protein HPB49_010269 [Dermacentor silvarum]|uniref:Uncharacterized protein n=1 Tax=Dermacentor silvarum TaxID=543639 RepID=A0ACB8DYF4_DERSI|nr:hypothetical protein HPB49_010269 [Dermacentor silvarum]